MVRLITVSLQVGGGGGVMVSVVISTDPASPLNARLERFGPSTSVLTLSVKLIADLPTFSGLKQSW